MLCTPTYKATDDVPSHAGPGADQRCFLRSFGVGMMGVLLGIYLFRTGLTSFAIGLVIAVGLAGAALATVLVSLIADRVGRRSFFLVLSLLSGVAGIALAISPSLPLLAMLAF